MNEEQFRSGEGVQHGPFDYMVECDKVCSTIFRPEQVEISELRRLLTCVSGFASDVNLIKKLLFRGKTRDELHMSEADGPTVVTLIEGLTAINGWSPADIDILHGAIGVITEAGEVADFLLKWAEGNPFDKMNVLEETGDLSWYNVRMLRGIGVTRDQCDRANIDKLHGRGFAEGFDVFADANRNLYAERSKLEDAFDKASSAPLFEEVPIVKNPELDRLVTAMDDEPRKEDVSSDLNAELHRKGVAHVRATHSGDMADMVDRIADEVRPIPKRGVRG